MKKVFVPLAMEQWEYWKKTNPNIAKRIKKILLDNNIWLSSLGRYHSVSTIFHHVSDIRQYSTDGINSSGISF